MKKIYSLLVVALFSVSAMAQVQSKAEQMMPAQMNAKYSVRMQQDGLDMTPATLSLTPNKKAPAAAAAAAADTLDYLRPVGAFFVGMSSDLGQFYPRIICDTIDTMTFYNNSALHTGNQMYWWLNSAQGSLLDTTWNLELEPLPEAYYYYPMPSLITVDESGENILNSYQYGSYYSDKAYVFAKPDYTMPFTTCAMYTDSAIEKESQDYWAVGAGSYGKYAYGSNLNVGTAEAPLYPDTLMVLFDNMSTMYMDSAFLTIYNYDANSIAEMIPAGATITLDLLPLGVQNGKTVILPTPISTATATNTDAYVYNLSGGGVVASLNFAFGTKNPLGGFTPAPVTYSGPFVACLSGFSSNGCNFGIYSDYNYNDYQTYYIINGSMKGLWKKPHNILLSLNAMFVEAGKQGIDNAAGSDIKPVKIIRDGQVLIQKGEKLYNVMGAEL